MTFETSCLECIHNRGDLWCVWGNDETFSAVANSEKPLDEIDDCEDFTPFEPDDEEEGEA